MRIESHMIRAASPSPALPSTYNDFLYARVGEEKSGALLTVLSVLARQNVDPWEEAADLSRLPRDSAIKRLVSMITASSGGPSTTAELRAIADRVIALLPVRGAPVGKKHPAVPGAPAPERSPARARLLLLALYMGLMFLGQWVASGAFEKTRLGSATTVSVPSKLGETRSSTTEDNGPHESPP
jgi:hypothetical protein